MLCLVLKVLSSPKLYVYNMAIWVVEFSCGGTKLERFLTKNQHTQSKLLSFENWCSGEAKCKRMPKFDIQSQFFMSKIIGIFLIFFFIEAHVLLLTLFENINF